MGDLHPYSPMGQIEHMGKALRSFKRRSETGTLPRWVSALGWLVVASFAAPILVTLAVALFG
jgi:hypothetical protein